MATYGGGGLIINDSYVSNGTQTTSGGSFGGFTLYTETESPYTLFNLCGLWNSGVGTTWTVNFEIQRLGLTSAAWYTVAAFTATTNGPISGEVSLYIQGAGLKSLVDIGKVENPVNPVINTSVDANGCYIKLHNQERVRVTSVSVSGGGGGTHNFRLTYRTQKYVNTGS